MNSQSLKQSADEQAAWWAAKLDGATLTAAERVALDEWLSTSPQHRALLSEYCQFSADLEAQLPTLVESGAVTMPNVASSDSPMRRFKALWLAGAFGATAAAVTLGLWATKPAQQVETVATSFAERKTVKLRDGSLVELNARTSMLVEFGASDRRVRIADGEAFFTVAKDRSRPFIVETPAGAVRVTGTVFDVHAETGTNFVVTVVEGSVQVTPALAGVASAPVALTATEQLEISPQDTNVRTLSAAELDDATAWRRGALVLDGTPLSVALARFSRFHGKAITVAGEAGALKVGGRYELANLDGFLNDIHTFLPVQVSRDESSGAISVTLRTGN